MSLFYKILVVYSILSLSLLITGYVYTNNLLYITFFILSLVVVAIYFYGVFEPSNNLFIKSLKGKDISPQEHFVLLRFDDGPDPNYTPRILDILKENKIQAIFAVTGENSLKYPHIIERIVKEKHILANHSYSHPYLISLYSFNKLHREIQRCNEVIEAKTRQKVKYYCPPMGHKSLALAKVLKKLNMSLLAWDLNTGDTRRGKEQIVNIIKDSIKAGDIVLFHDGIFKWTRQDREATVKSLEEIIIYLRNKNLVKEAE